VRVLELDQILSRLDDRLSLLVGGGRGAPSRQRTMRAALDWSFDLLSASEAALVCRLSVFAGGWTLDAAEAVCGDDQPSAGAAGLVARGDVLEHLARFVDKSLVRVAPGARYSMLETIREYARERLRLSGHEPAALARHFDWSSALAQAAGIGPTGGMSLERLDAERDNLRVALRWAIGERNEPVGGLTMSAALGRFWSPSGLWAEGRTWLEAALAAAPDAPPALRSIAVRHLSGLVQEQGDYAYAKTLLEAALAEQRDRGDAAEVLNTMLVLARVVDRMGDQDRARAYWVEGLALARAGGNRRKIGAALTGFGVHLMERGDYVRADEWLAESLDLFREIDSPDNVAVALHNLGENAMRCGEIDKAARLLEESLTIARARHLPRVVAYSSQMLGIVALSLGDFDRARTTLLEALTIDWDDGDRDGIAYVFEGLARLASERRDARRAQCLAGAAAGLRRCTQSTLPPCQQADLDIALERARTALGPESSAVCFDEGLAMTLYEAIVFARA